MKRLMLVSTEPNFFEEKDNTINRRGILAFPAMSVEEAFDTHGRLPMDLMVMNGTNGGLAAGDLNQHLQDQKEGTSTPCIFIAPREAEGELRHVFQDHPSVFVVPYPISSKYLLELSNKLLGVANRKYVRVLVQIKIPKEKASQTHFGFSRNVSFTGMLLETEMAFEVGDTMILGFMLPQSGAARMIDAKCVVVRAQKPANGTVTHFGVHFLEMSPTDRDRVADFCR
jgi:hypothetical protein